MSGITAHDRLALWTGVVLTIGISVTLLSVGFNPLVPMYHLNNLLVYSSVWVVILGGALLMRFARHRPASPFGYIRHEFLIHERRQNIRRAIYYSLVLSVFGTLFSLAKKSIPLFNSYGWDDAFIAADVAIHGQDAWRFLQPVLGFPLITFILSLTYHLWVLLIYIGNFYFIFFERSPELRARYVMSYLICWTLIGFIAAAAMASVGPCFMEPILGNHRFTDQTAYLHAVNAHYPVMVLDVQDRLLEWYRDKTATLGAGIAAMPSMHVSQAFLFFLAIRNKSRALSWGFGLFAFLILIASVHLSYHYAVDGYVAIAMTLVIWWGVGKLLIGSQR